MANSDDLPHLLLLLDDESSVVQTELRRAFCSLVPELQEMKHQLTINQRVRLNQLLEPAGREKLLKSWPDWKNQKTSHSSLGVGLNCIAQYQNGVLSDESLNSLIHKLATQFQTEHQEHSDPIGLSDYLFKSGRLQGNTAKYYDPMNSNLIHVIGSGRGNPISLTCVYILVASQLGMVVEGCNFPGHFLARVVRGEDVLFVDGFNGGQVLDAQLTETLRRRTQGASLEEILSKPASAQTILTRVLRNLVNGYRLLGQSDSAEVFQFLLKTMESSESGESRPEFSAGQLVQHRRYGYRGVVVDYDLKCTADEKWYGANRTKPDRNQPWYRVLVDDSDKITYAAQSSLKPDNKSSRVKHPLIDVFFSGFDRASYTRNATPWPKSKP